MDSALLDEVQALKQSLKDQEQRHTEFNSDVLNENEALRAQI